MFVQSRPPENNAAQDVGFDDRRIYPAHDPWAKTQSISDRSTTALSNTALSLRALVARFAKLSLGSRIRLRYLISGLNVSLVLHMLGREKVGILYLLVKSFVSVLEGFIDGSKSLHRSNTIGSAKLKLSDSVCR